MSVLQRLRLVVTVIALLLIIAITVIADLSFSNRPLQVRELAGKQVSMEKLADVFLGIDQIALENHYRRVWTYNGIIFLGAMLLIGALKENGKK